MTQFLDDGMVQCLYCAHVWDGLAQCNCYGGWLENPESNFSENVCMRGDILDLAIPTSLLTYSVWILLSFA